jgi:hypothetical protein
LRDKLLKAKDGYWLEHVDIQQKFASAWVLYAEGKYSKAMSAVADAEDKTREARGEWELTTRRNELPGMSARAGGGLALIATRLS